MPFDECPLLTSQGCHSADLYCGDRVQSGIYPSQLCIFTTGPVGVYPILGD